MTNRSPLRGRHLVAATLVLCSAPAMATCALWDFSSTSFAARYHGRSLPLVQSNGVTAYFDIKQDGEKLSGSAHYGLTPGYEGSFDYQGAVEGSTHGQSANFTVRWTPRDGGRGPVGVYELLVRDDGHIGGQTYNFDNPSDRATVSGQLKVQCLEQAGEE